MIVGPTSQRPDEWLLALGLTPDGRDIVCDDPITGKLVELSYEPATKTLGGVAGIFDPKIKAFAPLAEDNSKTPNGLDGVFVLKSFAPTGYVAIAVQ